VAESPLAPLGPVVVASANPAKVAELRAILGGKLDLVPRPDDVDEVEETEDDFEGNARLKATALVGATAMAAIADDSGLEVDFLEGAPGVRSARYGGESATEQQNVAKLLSVLEGVPIGRRRARFRCVLVLLAPDGGEVVAHGSVEGTITEQPRGQDGFGYDPVFVPSDGDGRTFAEMTGAEKHSISNRARAAAALIDRI